MFVDPPLLDAVVRGLLLSACGLLSVIALVRFNGLRSFSKMTNFDFAITVAVGSLLAGSSQATEATGWLQAIAAVVGLFTVQYTIARLRERSQGFREMIDNTPSLLMDEDGMNDEALHRHRIAPSDVIAKLREANVLEPSAVRAVVLEATGDISVLHGDTLDRALLDGVAGAS